MSRSFTPPDSLSKDDRRALADVRRAIWTDSFLGLAYGSVTALTGHTIVSLVTRSKKLNRNTALLSFLLGGSLGSFLAATTTGKNQVHSLHHIFQVGATSTSNPSSEGGQQEQQLKEELSPEVLKHNRVLRRKTLQNALESHSGLNDSHGGRWVDK
ncbi:hypothetical protein MHU86_13685 [Fragilaria crotonensis]|nr:hypothetical protein MHU86_13685 [Fragilaria crotonensis]